MCKNAGECASTAERQWKQKALDEEGYARMQVNGLVQQKDSGNKRQWKAEKKRRKWIGERNEEFSS